VGHVTLYVSCDKSIYLRACSVNCLSVYLRSTSADKTAIYHNYTCTLVYGLARWLVAIGFTLCGVFSRAKIEQMWQADYVLG